MLTPAQWTNTRRVDHINVLGFHPRVQGHGLTNLKVFDANVNAYALAANDFDRATILGQIIQETRAYVNVPPNTVPTRYINAVNQLYLSATFDLNQICGGGFQAMRLADLMALAAHQAIAPKNISLNVFYLTPIGNIPVIGPIDAVINNHIANANAAAGYIRAGITFVRTNANATVASATAAADSILLAVDPAVPVNQQGHFADGGIGGPRLITYCNASGGAANSIDIVYLDDYDQADVQGRTFRAGHDYGGGAADRPIVTVTLNPPVGGILTYPTTLAHELGHALTGYHDHSTDANNLMAGGAIRNANNTLSDGHIGWFRNNPNT